MGIEFIKTAVNLRFPEGKAKAVTFSYDDGVLSDVRLVELFNKYGIKCTFNINSGLIGADHPRKYGHERLGEKVLAMYLSGGHEIAMHSLTHPVLTRMDAAGVAYEIMQDRINLERITNSIIRGFAYPYGSYNDEVVGILKSLGVAYARTVNASGGFGLPQDPFKWDPTCHHFDENLMYCAKYLIEERESNINDPYLFYVWGHSYEFEDSERWNVIEDLTRIISGRTDIWYATNIEIIDYLYAFKSLIFNLERTKVYNPVNKTIYFERKGKNYCISPGQSIEISL